MTRASKLLILSVSLFVTACATTSGRTDGEKRQAIKEMRSEVLTELYQLKPDVRAQISKASGYGVFNNVNVNVILASFGGGYGIVKDNRSGKDTYMKMGELGVGFGAGIKDFRAVMLFHTPEVLKRFVDSGWAFGAQADAAAKASDKGGSVGGEVTVDNITIYQITKSGLALQATVKGTKFWKDDALN